jgi:hypothetical protein
MGLVTHINRVIHKHSFFGSVATGLQIQSLVVVYLLESWLFFMGEGLQFLPAFLQLGKYYFFIVDILHQ